MVTQERVVYSAANDQYGKPEKTVKTDVRKETPSGVASGLGTTGQSGGSLPFTGVSPRRRRSSASASWASGSRFAGGSARARSACFDRCG